MLGRRLGLAFCPHRLPHSSGIRQIFWSKSHSFSYRLDMENNNSERPRVALWRLRSSRSCTDSELHEETGESVCFFSTSSKSCSKMIRFGCFFCFFLTLSLQRFNADYELTARQGADTMAYVALLEEKLRPALLHTFWVDAENYANLTRPWFASRSPFPLNFLVPSHHANVALSRILLTKGEAPLHRISEVEGKIYSDAKECLNLLSYRLGTANYFFGNSPTSLDAFVFGFVAPLSKANLPSSPLQSHLRQLENLMRFCDNVLAVYFSSDQPRPPPPVQDTVDANLQKLTQLVNKESNLIEKMDDNLRSSPQHKPHRADPKLGLTAAKSSTPA
ncbi:metaxin-3 isoform X2 [Kryptolebias marmoratus]|uniref:metaxin-3 isoform X2 n=1 Tax=Kryptolebias marmoratus TaxID=37003 RepID=UPI0018ACA1A0|nr:metaxin-3 isoform X2 [Kryptolebias marmoratus]